MYRLNPELRLRRGPSETFWVFNLESGEHFELNETAYRVLETIERLGDPAAAARELAFDYNVDEAVTEEDVHELVRECTENGILTEEA